MTAFRLLSHAKQHTGNSSSHTHRSAFSPSSLSPASSGPVLLKPLAGGGDGEGLLVVSDEEQLMLYDFAEGQEVVMQELLVLDR